MAALPDRDRRDDERVWNVQRAGDELLEASAGDGARRHAAEGVCQDDGENADAVGSDSGLRRMLGALFGLGIQEARYFGHYALWRELDVGVRDTGGFADSRAGVEARVQSAGRAGWGNLLRDFPAFADEPGNGRERTRKYSGD